MSELFKTILRTFNAFMKWWAGELAALPPAKWKRQTVHRDEITIRFIGENVELTRESLDGRPETVLMPVSDDKVKEFLEGKNSKQNGKIPPVLAFVLDNSAALIRFRQYPRQAKDRLRELTALEIARSHPFTVDDVYFDVGVSDDDSDGVLSVEQVFVKRPIIDEAIARAARLGIDLDRICVDGAGPTIDLMPPKRHDEQKKSVRRLQNLKIVAVFSLILLTAFAMADRQARTLDALRGKVATARVEAAEAQSINAAAQSISGRVSSLRVIKNQHPSLLAIWEELSRAVPDSAWLTQIRVNGDGVTISGYGREAALLINELERTSFFTGVAFSAPVTLDRREKREKFTITMTYENPGDPRRTVQLQGDSQ